MNINATLVGEIIVISVIVVAALCYHLGKRKTNTPKMAAFIGALLSFAPPLNLIYLAVLVLKNDLDKIETIS
jgi:hypothetical protein